MLKLACRRFRRRFEPGQHPAHRAACAACAAYAAALEEAAAESTALPLPPGLAQRLRQIPSRELPCSDLDALWGDALRGDLDPAQMAKVREHLAACRRCARLWPVLEAAVGAPPLPLPADLASRLKELRRRVRAELPAAELPAARLPAALRQVRWALAASFLFAALALQLVARDPAAWQRAALDLRAGLEVAVAEGEARAIRILDAVSHGARERFEVWRDRLRGQLEAQRQRGPVEPEAS